jgi:hypothetical protein
MPMPIVNAIRAAEPFPSDSLGDPLVEDVGAAVALNFSKPAVTTMGACPMILKVLT